MKKSAAGALGQGLNLVATAERSGRGDAESPPAGTSALAGKTGPMAAADALCPWFEQKPLASQTQDAY